MRKKLGDLAVEDGWITKEERDALLARQAQLRMAGTGIEQTLLGRLLVEESVVDEEVISDLLRKQRENDPDNEKIRELWETIEDNLDNSDLQKSYSKTSLIGEDSLTIYTPEVSLPRELPSQYEILQEIAQGGMGIVYRANQISLQREIAIKTILSQQVTPQKRRKFIAESFVTAHLDHPNIIPVYDLSKNEQCELALAMKLVNGIEWKKLLHPETEEQKQRATQYDLEAHLRILLNVCNAVAFAHSKHIVHNDLKPANIMIGEFGEVLVMDWGIAVCIEDRPNSHMVHRGMIKSPIGTPGYMPKELAEGRGEEIGPWTDVCLLGAILYEVLMGKPPHRGNTIWAAVLSAIYGDPPRFSREVPRELQKICTKALAVNAVDRYPNVDSFRMAIEEFLQHRESLIVCENAESSLQDCLKIINEKKNANSFQTAIQRFLQRRENPEITGKKKFVEEERTELYQLFSQTIACFQQALALWEGNIRAIEQKRQALLAYAQAALDNDDIGLAESQISKLDESAPEKQLWRKKIAAARRKKEHAKKTARRLRFSLAVAILTIILVLSIALWIVDGERKKARKAEQQEIVARQEAQRQKQKVERLSDDSLLTLAQIALQKANESYNLGYTIEQHHYYEYCAAYAQQALLYLQKVQAGNKESLTRKLKKRGGDFLRLALRKRPWAWKTSARNYADEVKKMAFAGDGEILITSARDIRLWRVDTGEEIKALAEPGDYAIPIAVSPDGTVLATSSYNMALASQIIRLWDIDAARHTAELSLNDSHRVVSLDFSGDGQLLACATDSAVLLLHLTKGETIAQFLPGGKIVDIAFSADGKTIIAASSAPNTLVFWDVAANKKLAQIEYGDEIRSLALAANGSIVACALDKTVEFWDIARITKTASIASDFAVNAVSFSADGTMVVLAQQDGVRLLDASSNQQITHLTGHTRPVYRAIFSPYENILVSSSQDGTVRLWNLKTFTEISQFRGHTRGVTAVAYDSDGQTIVSTSSNDGTVRLWKSNTGKEIACFTGDQNEIYHGMPIGDGQNLLFSEDKTVWLLHIANREKTKLYAHQNFINSLALDAKGEILASACDETMKLWDLANRREIVNFNARQVSALAFAPEGKTLAFAGQQGTIKLWDIATKTELRSFIGHSSRVSAIQFNPKGKTFASSSWDGTVRLWDIETGKQLVQFADHTSYVADVAFRPDGMVLASCSWDKTARIWDLTTNKEIAQVSHKDVIHSLAFSKNGEALCLASGDGTIRLWKPVIPRLFARHKAAIYSLALSNDGKTLACAPADRTIRLHNSKTGAEVKKLGEFSETVMLMVFSPDDRFLAFAFRGGEIALLQIDTGEIVRKFSHGPILQCIVFSHDGKMLASASTSATDKTVKLWNVENGTMIHSSSAQSAYSLAFAVNNKALFFASSDKTAKMWQLDSAQMTEFIGHENFVEALALSPDNSILASASADKTVRLWDIDSTEEISRLTHESRVSFVAFSHDGRTLASLSDKAIRLWDIATSKEILKLTDRRGANNQVVFTRDSKRVFFVRGKTVLSCNIDNGVSKDRVDDNFALRITEQLTIERPTYLWSR